MSKVKKKNLEKFYFCLEFSNGSYQDIEVYHNLPISLTSLIDGWCFKCIHKPNSYNSKSFAKYVNSKSLEYICLTKEEYDKL